MGRWLATAGLGRAEKKNDGTREEGWMVDWMMSDGSWRDERWLWAAWLEGAGRTLPAGCLARMGRMNAACELPGWRGRDERWSLAGREDERWSLAGREDERWSLAGREES
ncbi:hypothetical protein ACLOJK_027012 [Asimina triloba]